MEPENQQIDEDELRKQTSFALFYYLVSHNYTFELEYLNYILRSSSIHVITIKKNGKSVFSIRRYSFLNSQLSEEEKNRQWEETQINAMINLIQKESGYSFYRTKDSSNRIIHLKDGCKIVPFEDFINKYMDFDDISQRIKENKIQSNQSIIVPGDFIEDFTVEDLYN